MAAKKPMKKPAAADFLFGTLLGEGAYARVVHAKDKATGRPFAVKILERKFIEKENKMHFLMQERNILSRALHPNIVKLSFAFRDPSYFYFVMELCPGGELLGRIVEHRNKQQEAGVQDKAMDLDMAKFYAADLFCGLNYIHDMGVVHRDLKPENVLLSGDGHVRLADFGTALDTKSKGEASEFVGTAEYVSPEVLQDKPADKACDLWAFACIIFQMLVGRPPFQGESEYLTFQLILKHPETEFSYPESLPAVVRDICEKLLLQDPAARLGARPNGEENDSRALKAHGFFEGMFVEPGGGGAAVDDGEKAADSGGGGGGGSKFLSVGPPPPAVEVSELPEPTLDGSNDDWMLAGVATELNCVDEPQLVSQEGGLLAAAAAAEEKGQGPVLAAAPVLQRARTSVLNTFLKQGESVIHQALVSKRKGLFSKRRQLILATGGADGPRLFYIDPAKLEYKGEVPWTPGSMSVSLRAGNSFDVAVPGRVYHFTDCGVRGSAETWRTEISKILSGGGSS